METSTISQHASSTYGWGRLAALVRSLPRRTLIIALAVAGAAVGLYLGWDWLAAAGLTSIVVGFLPCAAMCAAGLCAGRHGSKGGCHGQDEAGSGALPPEDKA